MNLFDPLKCTLTRNEEGRTMHDHRKKKASVHIGIEGTVRSERQIVSGLRCQAKEVDFHLAESEATRIFRARNGTSKTPLQEVKCGVCVCVCVF